MDVIPSENLPDFLVYESAKAKHCTASELIFSKLDIEELRERENDESNLSVNMVPISFSHPKITYSQQFMLYNKCYL